MIVESWQNLERHGRKDAICDPFTLLLPIYSLVAHHWNIFNTFMNQEIHNTEFILEVTEPAFSALELHLKSLYAHRRRCTKYFELLTELKEHCESNGLESWNYNPGQSRSDVHEELERDFEELLSRIHKMETRIDKNIVLLTALVNIGGGKQSLDESRGITRLTLFATTFIPASTVATILGIEQPFSPGSSAFWIFGAVAIPLTIAAFGIVFIETIKMWVLGAWGSSVPVSKKRKIASSKV